MTTPDIVDLSCPEGANFAAIALQMQETALETEAGILQLERLLRAAVNRPTMLQTSTGTITGLTAFQPSQRLGPLAGFGYTTNFNNTGLNTNIDTSARLLYAGLGDGLYQLGIYVNLVASGAVDDNSFRTVTITSFRTDPAATNGETINNRSERTVFETNTGVGVDICVTAVFRLTAADRVDFMLEHGNTSSTLNAPAGAVVWMSKLSSPDSVVVV